jgi:hypothetical protein
MLQLVNKSDLDNYKLVADSVKNATTWPQFVSEAQNFDVKDWLGGDILNEILTQLSTSPSSLSTANIALLNGGSYVYQTKTYFFQGLKACIIYYAFARFTNRSPYNYTAAGIVTKETEFSTPVSDKIIQRIEAENRLMAESIRDEVILFLNRNYLTYPLWKRSATLQRKVTFKSIGD